MLQGERDDPLADLANLARPAAPALVAFAAMALDDELSIDGADECALAASASNRANRTRRFVAVVLSVVETRWGWPPHAPLSLCLLVGHAAFAARVNTRTAAFLNRAQRSENHAAAR
jgi:hypothetical protein